MLDYVRQLRPPLIANVYECLTMLQSHDLPSKLQQALTSSRAVHFGGCLELLQDVEDGSGGVEGRWGLLKAVEGLLWVSGKCMLMTVCWKKSVGREVNGWSEARRCVAIPSFFECRAGGLKLFGKFYKLSSDCTCLYWPSWWGCQNDCQSSSGIASRAHPEGHGNHRARGFFAASTDHVRGATHSDRDVLMLQHATRSHQMLQTVFVSLLLEDALTSSQSSKTALEVDCSVHLSLSGFGIFEIRCAEFPLGSFW